jgi:hypothetical protein
MKFPSLVAYGNATERLRRSIDRFPVTFLLSLLLAGLTILEVELVEQKSRQYALARILLSLLVALPLQAGVEWLLAQSRHTGSRLWRWAPVAAGVLYYPLTGSLMADSMRCALMFSSAILIAVLLVSGWKRSAEEFSRRLASIVTAFLIAGLAGGVMNAGLFAIYFAARELLDTPVSDKVFLYTPILLHSTFTLGIYLSLLPDDDKTPESSPSWIDFLLRVVLVPVLSLYGAVLALYFGKILVSFTLPKGTVAANITAYALVGLASCLMAAGYPRPLFVRFFRWFQISLLVFIPMLVAGVARRILDYGFTEERALLLVLACALTWIAVTLGVLQKNRLQWILGTFIVLALVAVLSPLNVFTLSFASQKRRFEAMISSHQLVFDGKFIPEQKEMKGEELEELRSTLNYLVVTHGAAFLRPLVPGDWNLSLDEPRSERDLADSIINRIAFRRQDSHRKSDGTRTYELQNAVWYGPHRFPSQEIFPCQFLLGISGLEANAILDGLTLEISGSAVALVDRQKRRLLEVLPESLAQHAEERLSRENKTPKGGAETTATKGRSSYLIAKSDSVKLALGLQKLALSAEGTITQIVGHAYVQVGEPLCH